MEFATPQGFWLGLAAGGVLLAHLVRRRARRHVVPFLPVWHAVLAQQRGGFGAAVSRWLDLVLVLIACGAVSVAAGGPFTKGRPDTVRDLVVVLDGGVALRAGQRETRLRKVAEAEILRRTRGTRFVVVGVTDEGATVWTGDDKAGAVKAVRAHRPGWLAARRGEALALARAAARTLRQPDLVLCTYRPGREEGFRLRPVREAVANAGIVSLEVIADPESGGHQAVVGVSGRGEVEIRGHWAGFVDGVETVHVPLPDGGPVTLEVVAPDDGFLPDDKAYLLVPERAVPRVLVVSESEPSPFLTAALQALERTGAIAGPLDRTTPARAAEAAEAYDVLVFDRCAPAARPPGGLRALYVAPPPGPLPFRVGETSAAPALFEVRAEHPLLKGVDLARVAPLRARALRGGEPLAAAASGPVLAAAPTWVALGFDPDGCIFAASPNYPLFLRNCVRHLAEAAPTREPEYRAVGEAAPVRGVATIEGRRQRRVGARLVGPPGFWKIGDATIPVSLLMPDLDLRAPGEPFDPLPGVGAPGTPDRSLTAAFAAAAVLLLLLAWWAFWRG